MPVKVTLLFAHTSVPNASVPVPRSGGWSESYWHNSEDVRAAIDLTRVANGIVDRRARMLTDRTVIVGARAQRYTITDEGTYAAGATAVKKWSVTGQYPAITDIPHMAMHCRQGFTGAHPQSVSVDYQGIPDVLVVGGEFFDPTDTYKPLLTGLFSALQARGWGTIIDKRDTHRLSAIYSVTTGGLAKPAATEFAGVVAGMLVKVLRTRNAAFQGTGGVYRVANVAADKTVQLVGWDRGATTGGSMVPYERVFAPFASAKCERIQIVPRRVGRPFDLYRGRASKRARVT